MVDNNNDNDNAGVVAPPPLIFLAFLVAGLLFDRFQPVPLLPNVVQYVIGGFLIVTGLAVGLPATRMFRLAGTDVRPDKPTTAIVTTGPYRFTRNPIYLCVALLYAGIAVSADSIWALGLLILVIPVMNWGVIGREEKYLEGKFGKEYLAYKASARRWL